ncbi:exo-alpha-sialidase [soil metagenome]
MTTALIGTRKGLFGLDDDGVELLAFVGVPVTNVSVDRRDGTVFVAVGHGHFGAKVHRSDDGGATFTEVGTPTYPPKPDDAADVDPVRGTDVPWTVDMIWSLAPGHDDDADAVWAGTLPGGLFRSPDRGDSWELIRPLWDDPSRSQWFGGGYDLPGIHSICIDPRSADDVVVAISCGGVWRTEDRGASWTVRAEGMRAGYLPPEQAANPYTQDPHRVVRAPSDPDVLWCQHHSGMFRSTDNADSWTEITDVAPSTFGFAVAVHPAEADTAWFVPAVSDEVRIPVDGRMVVPRTADGGASFEAVGRGLPSERAFHLVYRHGLTVDDTGRRLLLGSTTGSMWISEDGGDSFETVTNDLPPVFSVAFR